MAALLIGMSVAAVLMTAVMPAWRQMARREKETELIFRGQQYVRAIGLFQKRSGPGVLPPNLDVLVTGHFLRKKFKDPITNDDFDLLSPTVAAGQAAPGQGGATQAGAQQGRGGAQPSTTTGAVIATQQAGGRGAAAGIIGVASKSKDASLRIFNGRTHYNEWQFIYVPQTQAAGAGAPGQRGAGPGGTPQRGNQPGGVPPGGFNTGAGRGQGGRGGPQGPQPGGRGVQPGSPFPTPTPTPFQPRAPR